MLQARRSNLRRRPVVASRLRRIEIRNCLIEFAELEGLLRNIGRATEMFKLNIGFDAEYFDARRWERLIVEAMPRLKRFDLDVDEVSDFDRLALHEGIHRFTSPFWTERNWSIQLQMNSPNTRFSIVSAA